MPKPSPPGSCYTFAMTTTPAPDLDWSVLHKDHHERIRALYGANISQKIISTMAITYPAEGTVSVGRQLGQSVDLSDLRAAVHMASIWKDETESAKREVDAAIEHKRRVSISTGMAADDLRAKLRDAYAAGAPARVLAEESNLSHARIAQIVAGARR